MPVNLQDHWTTLVSLVLLWIVIWAVITPSFSIQRVILVVCAAWIIGGVMMWLSNRRTERFEEPPAQPADTTAKVTTLSTMLKDTGFSSVQALRDFLNGNYVESVNAISYENALTLYYSVFSSTSIPAANTRTWKNIAPYFKNESNAKTCKLGYEDTHLQFGDIPYSNRFVGLELVSNNITGPESHQLGIQGNGTFSAFMVVKFNAFSANNTKPYELFKFYGNTVNNNAVSLTVHPQPFVTTPTQLPTPVVVTSEDSTTQRITLPVVTPPNVFNVQMELTFATQVIPVSVNGSFTVPLTVGKPYMFIVTKSNTKITMEMHDMTTKTNTVIKLVDADLTDPTVLLSNKRMTINNDRNLNANIYAFGLYNMFLLDSSFLHTHIYQELSKLSESFLSAAKNISLFQETIDATKACPYGEDVCKKCQIDDWTDFQKVITSSPECRQAVDEYCSKNIGDPRCKCWDPSNTTSECKSYVNIYRAKACLQVDNIDLETLAQIKKKYNLCDCGDMDKIKKSLADSGACPNQQTLLSNPAQAPKADDAGYYDRPIVAKGYDELVAGTTNANTNGAALVDTSVPGVLSGFDKPEDDKKKASPGFFSWLFGGA